MHFQLLGALEVRDHHGQILAISGRQQRAVGDWAVRWMEVTAEHADPDVVLWSWCQSFLRTDLLPEQRVVVHFRLKQQHSRLTNVWLLIERREGEICNFDPGFGDDLLVTVTDPLVFARWHLGLVEWSAALDAGAVAVDGPRGLCRALPTWNAYPQVRTRQRAEHARAPGGSLPLPPEAVAVHARPSRAHDVAGHPASGSAIPGFQGQVVTAADPEYDQARAVWNGAIDRRPRYVARCQSPDDVAAALRFGRDRDLPVTVRGGGHGVAGTAVCDSGLVIDLAPMKGVSIDPARRTAVVQAGALWWGVTLRTRSSPGSSRHWAAGSISSLTSVTRRSGCPPANGQLTPPHRRSGGQEANSSSAVSGPRAAATGLDIG